MDELLAEFLAETNENLNELDRALAAFSRTPADAGLIDKIFRYVHTIKSSCGFLKLFAFQAVAENAENILMNLRDKKIKPDPATIAIVSDAVGTMKIMFRSIEATSAGKTETPEHAAAAAWKHLPLIVHDLSHELGKKAVLKMDCGDIEITGRASRLIRESLTHITRNAVSHGIETPEARVMAGKPETGKITLACRREGKNIVIELSDDGAGLSVEKIRREIIKKGLAAKAEAASMPPARVYDYIFKPGFSTAEGVTSASGRGVGLDAARANITEAGGSIVVKSEEGRGTVFIIAIPATDP